jgi:hypothetical protein
MNTTLIIVLAVGLLAVAAVAVVLIERRRSKGMRARYGAEYIAAVDETGDRRKAEAELKAREKRVRKFDIHPLDREDVVRFSDRWRDVQARFVDDPGAAISGADELLARVMSARGYPVTDFEQRAADLSVEHPKLVSNYRLAHEVAGMHARGEAGTEDMRRAMIHYRELFEDLLGLPAATPATDERRTFADEETDHERAARVRDEALRDGDRPDHRPARERRDGPRGDGRAPRV